MKSKLKLLMVLLSACCALGQAQLAQAASPEPARRTYALIVAHNGSVDPGVKPLRYADDDGARYYELFSHLADDTTLLTVLDDDSQRVFPKLASVSLPPSKAQLQKSVRRLKARVEADRAKGVEVELYLIFTGHGSVMPETNEGYLSLSDGKLLRSELYRDILRPLSEASYTHLIIDACHAYFMVQSRGGGGETSHEGPWRDDRARQSHDGELKAYLEQRRAGKQANAPASSTLGVILSTSGAAEVHEWSKLRAGVFSHELRSGLLGGADVDGDGQITYNEIEAYLAAANAGVTNAKAKIQVWAQSPAQDRRRALVRVDDYRQVTRLKVPRGERGRYYVEDARGLRYADLHAASDGESSLVLLRGPVDDKAYYLRTEAASAPVALDKPTVMLSELAFAQQQEQARSSSVEESYRSSLFSTPYGPGFFAGFMAAKEQRPTLEQDAALMGDVAPAERWSARFGLSYGVSQALLGLSGLQHELTLNVPFLHQQGWVLGPYMSYGTSGHTSAADSALVTLSAGESYRLHRVSAGVELGFEAPLGDSKLRLGLLGRAGYQGVFLSSDALNADPLGARAEALVRVAWAEPQWALVPTLQAGWAMSLLRRATSQQGQSFIYQSPFVQLGVEF